MIAMSFDRYDVSELRLAERLVDRLERGMLCLADRCFFSYELWHRASATGADLLWRGRANAVLPVQAVLADGSYLSRLYRSAKGRRHHRNALRVRVVDYRLEGLANTEPVYRLITTMLDPADAPAAELAALYHERWEHKGIFSELKVRLPGERLILRSHRADLVEQELYGLLLMHFALRQLMQQASDQAGCDPDQLSFIHTVRMVRRQLLFHAAFSPSAATPDG